MRFPGSVGKPVPPFEALIVDDDGKELPPNTEGRLYFKDAAGRGIVYPNDPEKSRAAHLRPGVFTLGEVGYVNEEGFVFITDRFSDMVVSGGANLYPAEAEQVLINHRDVVDVACIGIPHAEMGEEMIGLAIVEPGAAVTGAQLVAWCRERLSHYKCPKRVEIVANLGRTAAGKINKKKLRDPYWQKWVAHAGLDPRAFDSGTSLHKPARISKKGNRHLRAALYMPAMVAAREESSVRSFYQKRLSGGLKPIQALVAVERKLLHAMHGMWSTNSDFDGEKFCLKSA